MFLYGKNSVYERLKANPATIRKLYLADKFSDERISPLVGAIKIKPQLLIDHKFPKLKLSDNLQGIVAEVDDFKYVDIEDLFDAPDGQKLSLIFLDRLYDPQNLGAIMRTAACFGGFAIVIPEHKACEVTESVLHVASGAENYVQVAMVGNTSQSIMKAKEAGYWIVGTSVEEAKDLTTVSLPFPLCLVMGSEGEGVRYGVDKHVDIKVKIPMQGAELSLNVATATAVCCYEIIRQKILNSNIEIRNKLGK